MQNRCWSSLLQAGFRSSYSGDETAEHRPAIKAHPPSNNLGLIIVFRLEDVPALENIVVLQAGRRMGVHLFQKSIQHLVEAPRELPGAWQEVSGVVEVQATHHLLQ